MMEIYPAILKIFTKPQREENEDIIRIKKALCELKRARTNFNMVVGADNVELAILELNAAEKRYQNLLKEAKINAEKRLYEKELLNELKDAVE